MRVTTSNLLILLVAGLGSLVIAWIGITVPFQDEIMGSVATWAGALGLVATLLMAATIKTEGKSVQHVIRIEPEADRGQELQLYARHNGYKQCKLVGERGFVRRDANSQPEEVVFEVMQVKQTKPAFVAPVNRTQPADNGQTFSY